VNDETVTENARKLVSCQLGNDNIVDLDLRMTAEDFSYYSQQVPATFFRIGVRSPNESNMFGLHNSRFNPDEDAIRIGMEAMLAIVFG
jgi:metal-dependent amidase/aminoacylase/carboxypeptidase family protein